MPPCATAYAVFYRWLLFAGVALFACYLSWQNGLLTLLLESDSSRISLVILVFFLLATVHAGWQAMRLGRETCATLSLKKACATESVLLRNDGADGVLVNGESGKASFAHEHLAFLALRSNAQQHVASQDLLLDRLDNILRRGHEAGWFVADLMIRLGLLGTVIGFIFMLSAITTIDSIDLRTIQHLLGTMSNGMRIALYTTLSGLGTGILLSFQYQMLDQAADRLLADIIELSEVQAMPHLHAFIGDR